MKILTSFGVSVKAGGYINASEARGHTYTTKDDQYPSTNLLCPDNPYIEEIKNAKNILDIGCGIGRNLPWVMENTAARYWGLDPNRDMLKYFWETQDHKWIDRVHLCDSFDMMKTYQDDLKLDVVVSTFVFQHIGFRPPGGEMNASDISNEIKKFTRDGTVWFLFEHQREETWINQWAIDMEFLPLDVWVPGYRGLPELNDRGADHHLIVHKEHKHEKESTSQTSS